MSDGAPTRWIADPAEWDGGGTAVLLLTVQPQGERRDTLRALAGRVPGLDDPAVTILHRDGFAPRPMRGDIELPRPFLSSASRSGFAALAVGPFPLGIDVEIVGREDEIAPAVLADEEAALLCRTPSVERAASFARIWSVKEAYLKALRLGLSRDPATLCVRNFRGDGDVRVVDPAAKGMAHRVECRLWKGSGADAAVSLVVIPDARQTRLGNEGAVVSSNWRNST